MPAPVRHARNALRAVSTLRSLLRHDALFPLALLPLPPRVLRLVGRLGNKRAAGRPGERLAAALLDLGPAFVKLGQSLATRDDLIGAAVARDLARLQGRLAPEPAGTARATVEAEFGRPLAELFASFAEVAGAAASVAEVHRATTTEGAEVAVKILRPGIERRIERDLDFLAWLAALVERWRPSLRRYRPVETVRQLAAITRRELDLRMEAAAAAEFGRNCADADGFRVPRVDWQRTSRRVATYEWVEGMPIDDRAALLAAGHDPDRLLERSAKVLFNQVFRDGFFHGDMHHGNMLVDRWGDIVALDFGIMGRIDPQDRRHLALMLVGFLARDYERVADVFFAAGFLSPEQDRASFQQAVRSIGEPILDRPLHEISMGRILGQLLRVAEAFEMRQQPQLVLLQKTMVVAEGVGRRLNPRANIWQLAEPLIVDWIRANLGPQAELRRFAGETVEAARGLPRLLARLDAALAPPAPAARRHRALLPWLTFALGLLLGIAWR